MVKGPAATGTRHQAREIVAGLWATNLSAHELYAQKMTRVSFHHQFPVSSNSRESKDTHVSRDFVLASLAAGKNVTNDAGRGLLPRAPLAHHSQHSTQRDAVARAVLHRNGFAPASPSWAGGSVHGCQRSVVAWSNWRIFWQWSILKHTIGVRSQTQD